MAIPIDGDFFVDRSALSAVFKDPRTLLAFETALQVVQATPAGIDEAQQTADGAQSAADQAALDAAAADAAAAAAAAAASGAQGTANAISAAEFVVLALSTALSNERVLQGGTGVTIDTATANVVKVLVNVASALGYTPANKAGDTIGASTFSGAVDVQAALRCDSLRIDAAPAVSVTVASHALAIDLNGTTYYLKLSATP